MRQRLKFVYCFLFLSAIVLSVIFLGGCNDPKTPVKYTVMVPSGTGYTVNGESIKTAMPDESVVFDINLSDGYEFVYSNVGDYADGRLTIDNVKYSVTVDFTVRLSSDIASAKNGNVTVLSVGGGAAEYGNLAEFRITPNENYNIEEVYLNGNIYDFICEPDGTAAVTEIFNEYVSVYAVCLGRECRIVAENTKHGVVSTDCEDGIARYGETVSVKAIPDEDYILDYFIIDGENFYDVDTYEFTVSKDVNLSAHFVGNDFVTLSYDLNGGECKQSLRDTRGQAGEFVYLPNGAGAWEYEGYTLESWNTEKDGSGERHALGAMIAMPDRDETVMYAQYKKQTESEHFGFGEYIGHTGERGYEIVRFQDESKSITEVVLPDKYNGKKVMAVADNVFRGVDSIVSVVTNANIEKIGSYAFGDMPDLTELYLYDSLRNLSRDALSGSDLRKLHINSATGRIYDKILESNIVDKQMYVKTSQNKKIVTLSGCSLAKGMHSEMFSENEYLKDYDVIHMGVHARYGLGLLMDMVDRYLNAGDIVVISLENYEHLWLTEKGMELVNTEQPWRLRHFESNYDVYEEFDFVESKGKNDILPVLWQYFAERADDLDNNRTVAAYPGRDMMNEHGDYTYLRPNAAEGDLGEDIDTLFPGMSFLDGVENINAWAQKHMDRGVKICFIFPPVYRYKAYDDEENASVREEFQTKLKQELAFPVLGSIDDAAMPYYCFSDWINHPSTEGSLVYTKRFIELLSDAVAQGVI